MKSVFFKGLLAVLIGTIASLISVQAASAWFYVLTIVGVVIAYFVQHAFVKPISIFGTLDVTDLIKGLLLAVVTGLTTYTAQLLTTGFSLKDLLQVVVASVVLYLGKNFASDSNGKFLGNNAEYKHYKQLTVRARQINLE